MTGLDPEGVRAAEGGLPPLPVARNGRVSVDPEAVVRLPDGSLLVGDEYGPNIYRFTASGRLVSATAPPAALTPMRRGRPDYSSDNPAPGGPHPSPKNPETGRQNNQGLGRARALARPRDRDRRAPERDPPGRGRRSRDAAVYPRARLRCDEPGRACAQDGSGGASARLPERGRQAAGRRAERAARAGRRALSAALSGQRRRLRAGAGAVPISADRAPGHRRRNEHRRLRLRRDEARRRRGACSTPP